MLQVALLEWTDDLEVFILKGYGKSLNYRMGVPLLEDIVQSMEQAIKAKEGIINLCFSCCLPTRMIPQFLFFTFNGRGEIWTFMWVIAIEILRE